MRSLGHCLLAVVLLWVLSACSQNTGGKVGETAQPPAPPSTATGAESEQLPPGHPPVTASPQDQMSGLQVTPPPAGSGTGGHSLAWDTPADWIAETPSNPMRRAQMRVPGPGGEAKFVVSYLGPGQGGEPMANAEIWAHQFLTEDGAPATQSMKTTSLKVGSISVLLVEVKGTFLAGGGMGMEPTEKKPGYMLLGAVAEGPDANWFFKFTGPEKTLEAQRGAFDQLVRSIRKGA